MLAGQGYCTEPTCSGSTSVQDCSLTLCQKHWLEHQPTDTDNVQSESTTVTVKEIEWWNEITPWKNSENLVEYSKQQVNTNENDIRSITYRTYTAECPLTFDGAYGLIQSQHHHQLCISTRKSKKKIGLYQHFKTKHGFTREISSRLVRAVIHQESPLEYRLFSSNHDTPSTLFDPYHKVKCPLANRTDLFNTPCSISEITRKCIRRHLLVVHRLDSETINQLIKQIFK